MLLIVGGNKYKMIQTFGTDIGEGSPFFRYSIGARRRFASVAGETRSSVENGVKRAGGISDQLLWVFLLVIFLLAALVTREMIIAIAAFIIIVKVTMTLSETERRM